MVSGDRVKRPHKPTSNAASVPMLILSIESVDGNFKKTKSLRKTVRFIPKTVRFRAKTVRFGAKMVRFKGKTERFIAAFGMQSIKGRESPPFHR